MSSGHLVYPIDLIFPLNPHPSMSWNRNQSSSYHIDIAAISGFSNWMSLNASQTHFRAICDKVMTTNSAGFSGAKPITTLTMPWSISAWLVVCASHLTK